MKLFYNYPILIFLLFIFLAMLVWGLFENASLMLTEYRIRNAKIPADFDGFRIAQVSDLHNTEFGPNNIKLLTMLENAQPDLIAITGDLVDSRRTAIALSFVREAAKIAPIYYVPGNHEAVIAGYADLKTALKEMGVVVLENENTLLERENSIVTLTGLMDPFFTDPATVLPELTSENYQIVLSHRPELIDLYAQHGLNLVFTGHAHGGQIRLPFVGGILAPHQGLFPKYDAGLFTQGETTMVVSRGLGNSLFPLRFNNRPELILATLESI